MAVSYMDYTSPQVQYTYDLRNNLIFQKDAQNYIFGLGYQQLNTVGNTYLLDVHLSKGNIVEPHYHPNATEVLTCISGAVAVSFINPVTKERKGFSLQAGQVVSFPQGWLHEAMATEDRTHLLAAHDTPMLQTVWLSDLLRLLPPQLLAYTYNLKEQTVKEAFEPITDTVIIGPPHATNHPPHKKNEYYLHNQQNP